MSALADVERVAPMGRFDDLPRPVGFVLAGGATLGAVQVGMVAALADHEVRPDLVVGCSVGALNGAVVAAHRDLSTAAQDLTRIWRVLRRPSIFPGGRLSQAWRVLRGRTVFPNVGLQRLVQLILGPRNTFDDLSLPFGVVASNVLTGHASVFHSGTLKTPLLASAALPGVFPIVDVDGVPHWDGAVSSLVPLRAAVRMGARSLVVLDPGDINHREIPPAGMPAQVIAAFGTAIRQRVQVEALQVADEVPLLYLDRPQVPGRKPLSFGSTPSLIRDARRVAGTFLDTTPVPTVGTMAGRPHHASERGAWEPRFVDRRESHD